MWHIYIQMIAHASVEHMLLGVDHDDLDWQDYVWQIGYDQYAVVAGFPVSLIED